MIRSCARPVRSVLLLPPLIALLILSIAPPALSRAQPAAQPADIAPPDTPAGRQLAWALDFLNGAELADPEARFTQDFLDQVPAEKLRATAVQLRAQLFDQKPVKLAALHPGSSDTNLAGDIVTDSGTHLSLIVHVDKDSGKINGLLIRPAAAEAPPVDSFAQLDDLLDKLPGVVNASVFRLGPLIDDTTGCAVCTPLYSRNGDQRLALGSAFKLYILGTLAEQVRAGQAAWDEPLKVQDSLKSLPSGDMQLQPDGATFPLSHFADKMISISDNTATDHLLNRAGRANVEAYMSRLHGDPARNKPFLSTMEMFRIKLAQDHTLAARYADADEATRRAMIARAPDGSPEGEVARVTPNLLLASGWKKPIEISRVEWFATPDELARVMADLHRLEQLPGMEPLSHALRINPGLPLDRKVWTKIAFKGGSEPGVLNGAWMLERNDGALFIVTMGWSDPDNPVDESKWAGLVTAAANLTAKAPKN